MCHGYYLVATHLPFKLLLHQFLVLLVLFVAVPLHVMRWRHRQPRFTLDPPYFAVVLQAIQHPAIKFTVPTSPHFTRNHRQQHHLQPPNSLPTHRTTMPPPSGLAIATKAVERLVKEEAFYRAELAKQQDRVRQLAAEIAAATDPSTLDGNAEFVLKQEVCSLSFFASLASPSVFLSSLRSFMSLLRSLTLARLM